MRIIRVILVLAVVAVSVLGFALGLGGKNYQALAQTEPTGKVKEILDRGQLNCGVSGTLPGFANVNPDTGRMEGIDADFCRVIAVAIFGTSYTEESVNFVSLTADVRFTSLQAGEIDVLIRNTTWTLTREVTMGSDFGPTTFYDGQGLLARSADGFGSLADTEGATFCSTSGTTTEKNITDAYRTLFGADPNLALGPDEATNIGDFEAGRCDILTSDKSQLASLRSVSTDPSSLVLLPDTLSKEPLGPMYLSGDVIFADIVNWSVYTTFQAEEYGVTSENVDDMMGSEDVQIQRFLGLTEDGYGSQLGIANSFAADIVRTLGNYAEIYERNVEGIVTRAGTLNELWKNGGLLYSPAWR